MLRYNKKAEPLALPEYHIVCLLLLVVLYLQPITSIGA